MIRLGDADTAGFVCRRRRKEDEWGAFCNAGTEEEMSWIGDRE